MYPYVVAPEEKIEAGVQFITVQFHATHTYQEMSYYLFKDYTSCHGYCVCDRKRLSSHYLDMVVGEVGREECLKLCPSPTI